MLILSIIIILKLWKNFVELNFQSGLLLLVQKATRLTRTKAFAIDHIITDAILKGNMNSGIIKTKISDHFLILAF